MAIEIVFRLKENGEDYLFRMMVRCSCPARSGTPSCPGR
jgi:hypothetical protein